MMIPTLNVVDQAVAEVQDKMKYFEGRSNQLLGEMSNAMTTLSGVTVEPVESAPQLPSPENAQYQPIDTPDAPELNVIAPAPHILDLDIERPAALTSPNIPTLTAKIKPPMAVSMSASFVPLRMVRCGMMSAIVCN